MNVIKIVLIIFSLIITLPVYSRTETKVSDYIGQDIVFNNIDGQYDCFYSEEAINSGKFSKKNRFKANKDGLTDKSEILNHIFKVKEVVYKDNSSELKGLTIILSRDDGETMAFQIPKFRTNFEKKYKKSYLKYCYDRCYILYHYGSDYYCGQITLPFRSVSDIIRNFHTLETPISIPRNASDLIKPDVYKDIRVHAVDGSLISNLSINGADSIISEDRMNALISNYNYIASKSDLIDSINEYLNVTEIDSLNAKFKGQEVWMLPWELFYTRHSGRYKFDNRTYSEEPGQEIKTLYSLNARYQGERNPWPTSELDSHWNGKSYDFQNAICEGIVLLPFLEKDRRFQDTQNVSEYNYYIKFKPSPSHNYNLPTSELNTVIYFPYSKETKYYVFLPSEYEKMASSIDMGAKLRWDEEDAANKAYHRAFTRMYGKENADRIMRGEVRFGDNEEIVKFIHQFSPFRYEKVSTPFGWAKCLWFFQEDLRFYFQNDRLMGWQIGGKKPLFETRNI